MDQTTAEQMIRRLAAEVEFLRTELDHLRQELAREVRTHRVVVLDHEGAERIVAETLTASAQLSITSKGDDPVRVSLYASEEHVEGPDAGVCVTTEWNSTTAALSVLGTYDGTAEGYASLELNGPGEVHELRARVGRHRSELAVQHLEPGTTPRKVAQQLV